MKKSIRFRLHEASLIFNRAKKRELGVTIAQELTERGTYSSAVQMRRNARGVLRALNRIARTERE